MSSYPYRSFNNLRVFPKTTSGTKFLYRTNYPVTFNPPPQERPVETGIVTSWVAVPEMQKSFWQAPLDSPKHVGCIRCQKNYPGGCPFCRYPGGSTPMGMCQCNQSNCVCKNITMGQQPSYQLNTGRSTCSGGGGCGGVNPRAEARTTGGCNCGLSKPSKKEEKKGFMKLLKGIFGGDEDEEDKPKGGCGCGGGKVGSLNLLDPKFNLREVCKNCILLEDHLFQREKRCDQCIVKHLLTIEAFLEEAITLDNKGELTPEIEKVLAAFKEMAKTFAQNKNYMELGQKLRDIRKTLMIQPGVFECGFSK